MGINSIIAVNQSPSSPVILTLSPDERKELKGKNLAQDKLHEGAVKQTKGGKTWIMNLKTKMMSCEM